MPPRTSTARRSASTAALPWCDQAYSDGRGDRGHPLPSAAGGDTQHGCDGAQPGGNVEREVVRALDVTDIAGPGGCHRRAELVRGELPAEHDRCGGAEV